MAMESIRPGSITDHEDLELLARRRYEDLTKLLNGLVQQQQPLLDEEFELDNVRDYPPFATQLALSIRPENADDEVRTATYRGLLFGALITQQLVPLNSWRFEPPRYAEMSSTELITRVWRKTPQYMRARKVLNRVVSYYGKDVSSAAEPRHDGLVRAVTGFVCLEVDDNLLLHHIANRSPNQAL